MPKLPITHWSWVMHTCVGNLTVIGPDNGLSPDWRQAVIWTRAGILLIRPSATNCNEILIKIHTFWLKKIHLKIAALFYQPHSVNKIARTMAKLAICPVILPGQPCSLWRFITGRVYLDNVNVQLWIDDYYWHKPIIVPPHLSVINWKLQQLLAWLFCDWENMNFTTWYFSWSIIDLIGFSDWNCLLSSSSELPNK